MGMNGLLVKLGIFLLLFFLPGDTSPITEPQYLVLVPYLIHTDSQEKVCIQLTHLNESVTLSATVEDLWGNRSLIDDVVSEKDVFTCIPFSLPKPRVPLPFVFLNVTVRGATLQFSSRKVLAVQNSESLVFIQTDKPIYKPGQTVLFRIVSLDEEFRPVNEMIPLVYIEDPKKNRLYQWTNAELEMGFIQLFFNLTSEPMQGTYTVVAQKASGKKVQHSFSVEEYVLPKFEVTVKMPKVISILDEELKVTVCGLYTFGKPVPGLVNFRVCRNYERASMLCYGEESRAVCEEFSGQTDIYGCISEVVKTKLFQLKRRGYENKLHVEAKIKEEDTGVELTGTSFSEITTTISRVTFELSDTYYKRGVPFFGQVKLVDGSNAPIANETVRISVQGGQEQNYTTNEEGIAEFALNTSSLASENVGIRAVHKNNIFCYDHKWVVPSYGEHYLQLKLFYSPSNSFLKIEPKSKPLSCGSTTDIWVHYILTPAAVGEQKKITFYYLVMAKGNIKQGGTHILDLDQESDNGIFSLQLSVQADIAPVAQVLVYTTVSRKEVIADSAKFYTELCFNNKVDLSFSPSAGLPASDAHLQFQASPNSLCAVRAVDKSVLLMKPEADLSPTSVYDLLPVKEFHGYVYDSRVPLEESPWNCVTVEPIVRDGITYVPEMGMNEEDTYSILKEMGLKVFTNTNMKKPRICSPRNHIYAVPAASRLGAPAAMVAMRSNDIAPETASYQLSTPEEVTETVRKYFPETWIWSLVPISSEGKADLEVIIPDTITEWKANAFCTSADTGFGLSPTVSLRAFQPFFVELTMPYSVVRGESFTLKATVFNYLPACIRVSVTLAQSTHFLATLVEKEEESHCLCENGRKTVAWLVTPKSLGQVEFSVTTEALQNQQPCGNYIVETPEKGRKDTVIRQLLVEPEGVEKETTQNSVLCVKGVPVKEEFSLLLPENVVPDSGRAYFSVLGDIMGTAMQNLHQLLQMPFGCGEQNMVLFAPNIYVLDYLNKTGQLSEEIKSKATGYLVSGYQRQLNYKHQDGSYSTFGQRYGQPGNTWLTAFVLKSFAQARHHIFIEERHIQNALLWLSYKQKENGCFQSSGTLLNNAMKGGVDNEATLTAYITIALLEIPLPVTHSVVRNALFCLETAANQKENHVYTKALLAYAFALAGNRDQRKALLDSLEKEAVRKDGSVHWQRPGKEPEADLPFHRYRAPSAEVEMTAYVLLAQLTSQPAPAQEELVSASLIAKWISSQQNPNGGFSSTQDTVVALQALSLYGAATYAKSGAASKVALQSGGDFQQDFQVDPSNRLLLQRVPLPQVPGEYSVEVSGEGCVYLQTSLRYNVQPTQEEAPFLLHVHTVPEACGDSTVHKVFDIAVNVSYTGERNVSNMVIVDVKMLSGFVPLKSSVRKLEAHPVIERTELNTNHVLLYLEKLGRESLSFSFTVERDIPVRGLKPAQVKVYDYYETDEFATQEYSAPCATVEAEQGNY
ncbi:alpha-2-macroglobulin [Ammospiza nelsoni]|uniref:alpha-2-macroglobulin n=1 Tax=Ammospiza nelsoni TaxID=2857394 RepID=UPI002869BB76|nr:alpha-2-macroglobulin [Ammospiza nelsoni]